MLLTVTGESTLWTLLSSTRISLKIQTRILNDDFIKYFWKQLVIKEI